MLRKARPVMLATAGVFVLASQAFAQSGSVEQAVGGYTFEEAAKEGRRPRISTPMTAF